MANMVQRLYETCKDVFRNGESGYVPPPADIQRLTAVLDAVNAEEMNLTSMRLFRRRRSRQHHPPAIIYIHIYECDQFSQGGRRLAKVKVDADLSAPCDVSVLFPAAGGNMHCFRALTPCAILDVLGPPYSQAQGRNCTYYHDSPFTPFSSDVDVKGYAWLEERAKPESFIVAPAPYSDPTILER
nr:plant cysteine oxidase 2 [Ipomoea batatas]